MSRLSTPSDQAGDVLLAPNGLGDVATVEMVSLPPVAPRVLFCLEGDRDSVAVPSCRGRRDAPSRAKGQHLASGVSLSGYKGPPARTDPFTGVLPPWCWPLQDGRTQYCINSGNFLACSPHVTVGVQFAGSWSLRNLGEF